MVVVKIGPNSETRKSDKGEFVGSGCSPPHKLGGKENAVSSRSGVWGKAPAIWQFRTFYRLTKPLLVWILLTPIYFSEIFTGARATEDTHKQTFVGSGPLNPHGIGTCVTLPAKIHTTSMSLSTVETQTD